MRRLFLFSIFYGAVSFSYAADWDSPEYSPTVTKIESTQSSWYELPQYYDGTPKYSGLMGTYPAKILPVAVSCKIGKFAAYNNNQNGDLEVHVVNLNTSHDVKVYTLKNYTDPHHGGAIQCVGDTLYLQVAARGQKRIGHLYSSHDGINWKEQETNWRAYPQMHNVEGKLVTLYTEYKTDKTQQNGVSRKIYSSCNNEPIVNDKYQHYMLSYYNSNTKKLYVVYNDVIDTPDHRVKLHYTYSRDGGCHWIRPLTWYDGDKYVYLKDFRPLYNDKMNALVVLSDSADPNKGKREIWTITSNGLHRKYGSSNHNYTTGALTSGGDISFPDGGNSHYAGGKLYGEQYCNYVRRIDHTSNEFVASCGYSGSVKSDGWISLIKE